MYLARIFQKQISILNLSTKRFAGHSKWANIKHIKGIKDAQRSALFARLSRLMKVAIQEGKSSNPNANLQLQQAIDQAKRANMPIATIQNVLKSSQTNKSEAKKHILDLRGPGGCFILLEIFTDNLTACKQMITPILKKCNAQYTDANIRRLFDHKGIINCKFPKQLESKVGNKELLVEVCTEHAIVAGAEDIEINEDEQIVHFFCEPKLLETVATELEKQYQYTVESKLIDFIPNQPTILCDIDWNMYEKLYEKLESINDVINIYDNVENST